MGGSGVRMDVFAILIILGTAGKLILGSKILVTVSGGNGSHFMSDYSIAKTLAARGHEVWIALDDITFHERIPKPEFASSGIKCALYSSSLIQYRHLFIKRFVSNQLRDSISALRYLREAEDREIQAHMGGRKADVFTASSFIFDDLMADKEFWDTLKSVNFDMITGDVVHNLQVLLGTVFEVPFIQIGLTTMVPSQHDHFAHNPVNPAYVPERLSVLGDTLNFWGRLKNALLYWITYYFHYKYTLSPMDEVLRKHNIVSGGTNLARLLPKAEMWIFSENFVVDFPRPLSPHVKFVGGFLTSAAKPLNEEWQSFIDSSGEHGIVLLALGTLINDELTDDQAENIATSLSLLPQKVAWSYSGKLPKTLGNNTKIVKWLPQNDLLGHPKMRAFISHGGLNSIHQCIYHAVPIVGIPVFGDQKDNFVRLRAKGLAVFLDIRKLTGRSIYEATVEVIYNKTYKESAERYSEISRDRVMPMTPLEETAYWIEYAIKHGTQHLKPRSMQLTTIQYYLLDVIAVYLLIISAVCWFMTRVFCCVCRRCSKTAILKDNVRKQEADVSNKS